MPWGLQLPGLPHAQVTPDLRNKEHSEILQNSAFLLHPEIKYILTPIWSRWRKGIRSFLGSLRVSIGEYNSASLLWPVSVLMNASALSSMVLAKRLYWERHYSKVNKSQELGFLFKFSRKSWRIYSFSIDIKFYSESLEGWGSPDCMLGYHIYNGILLSHKKKWNWVICSEVDGLKRLSYRVK